MKFKKLEYYKNAVKTSEKDCQEENFIMGLVKFFDEFDIFYDLLLNIEREYNTECVVLPSFNVKSEDKDYTDFKTMYIKLKKEISINELQTKFNSITKYGKEYSFEFFLEDKKQKKLKIKLL